MGFGKFTLIGAALAIAIALNCLTRSNDPPRVTETLWRPDDPSVHGKAGKIEAFRITVPPNVIEDLKFRLNNTRGLLDPLKGTGWTYGTNNRYLKTILEHWSDKYNFVEREKYLNQYPHFKINVQGLDIHFVRVKPTQGEEAARGKRVLPLLALHGWPSSVLEFYKILPLLTTPREEMDFAFEVIVASLPGFGFSSPPTIPGLGNVEMALVMKNFMLALGFDKFYTQGGDWGAIVTADMASMFPEHVLGMHSNMCMVMTPWTLLKTAFYSFFPSLTVRSENHRFMHPLRTYLEVIVMNAGYFYIQATKPDTVGVGVSDSPAGLAAYVLEKFSINARGFDRDDGGLSEYSSLDELIDNLMIYWLSNSMTSSMRIYAETFNAKMTTLFMSRVPVNVASACAQFPGEIFYQPAEVLKDRYVNLIRATAMPRGGHFAAFEEPQLLADDIWAAIGQMEENRVEK